MKRNNYCFFFKKTCQKRACFFEIIEAVIVSRILHIVATDGCFDSDHHFMMGITPKAEDLLLPFQAEVFQLLKKEGRVTDAVINNILSWNHTGFHVYCGEQIGFVKE